MNVCPHLFLIIIHLSPYHEDYIVCEISSSHGGEYDVLNYLLGCTAM